MKSSSIATAFAELEREWLACSARKLLLKLIEKHLLTNQRIDIDSALCLGLGSFSKRSLQRLMLPRRLSSYSDGGENSDQNSQLWSLSYHTSSASKNEDEDHTCRDHTNHQDSRDTNMAHDGTFRNVGLYQLLLFETVCECLRSKFTIHSSLVQDPEFTAADHAFLKQRGHTVIIYPSQSSASVRAAPGFPLDPSLLQRISNRTFFFAPRLDISVSVDVMLAAKPSLYWGHDMCLDVAYPYFLNPYSPGHPRMTSYVTFAQSYAFLRAPVCGECNVNYGFMYPADPSDQEALSNIQQRVKRADTQAQKNKTWIIQLAEENTFKQKLMRRCKDALRKLVQRCKCTYHGLHGGLRRIDSRRNLGEGATVY